MPTHVVPLRCVPVTRIGVSVVFSILLYGHGNDGFDAIKSRRTTVQPEIALIAQVLRPFRGQKRDDQILDAFTLKREDFGLTCIPRLGILLIHRDFPRGPPGRA